MKKQYILLLLLLVPYLGYSQTFSQTFVDRCTGKVQIVTANFVTGSAVVAFYDEVRIFSYQEFVNGELQQWLLQKYSWWQALSPCSKNQQEAQQAQQAASNAAQAAQAAQQVPPPPPAENQNSSQDTGGGTENTGGGEESTGGGEESTGGGEESTESTEEGSGESENEGEESSEDSEEEGSEEESEEEESEEEESRQRMPIQLKADLLGQQSLTGSYNSILNIGASRSSVFGDLSYGSNIMIWDNLRQVGINMNRSRIKLTEDYEVKGIRGISLSYMRNYRMNGISLGTSVMKPVGDLGVVGIGANYSYIFGKDAFKSPLPQSHSVSMSALISNSFLIRPKITYSPAIILLYNPLSVNNPFTDTEFSTGRDVMGVLSNSFTVQLTRRFSFNAGWTLIYSTNEIVPLMNAFMIGSKLPF